jgi:pimeloyl-ACP methyl ester carboxylesterase
VGGYAEEAVLRGIAMSRGLLGGASMLVAILSVGSAAAPAGPPALEDKLTAYLAPQLLVPIEKGRTINLVCLGQGSPTVVITPGLGHWSWWWWNVQLQLAERTRVCAWDRAGWGFSSPSPEPQDIVHTTADFERALKKADIAGPYVMVGHSLGAFESVRFTDRHQESVVGMVLVDPDIPDRAAVEERLAPQFARVSRTQNQSVTHRQDCAAKLRAGAIKSGTPEFERCTAAPGVPTSLFPRQQAAMSRLNADPARLLTQASTEKEHFASAREAVNAQRRYGDMPLIVLTAKRADEALLSAVAALPPDTPGATTPEERAQLREQVARFIREGWHAGHEAYAALSTRGRDQIVDSGHNIIVEKPDAVISAIVEVLDESR